MTSTPNKLLSKGYVINDYVNSAMSGIRLPSDLYSSLYHPSLCLSAFNILLEFIS